MALAGQLTVTPEELENQASQVSSTAKELQQSFAQIRNMVNETGNYWIGQAADAHRESYWKHQDKIDEIVARYNEHVRDLQAMAGIYREAETAATNMADELPAITL